MIQLSDREPFSYLINGTKCIEKEALTKKYVDAYGEEGATKILDFLTGKSEDNINNWNNIVNYIGENDNYYIYEYYHRLKPMTLEVYAKYPKLKENLNDTINAIYLKMLGNIFTFEGQEVCIGLVDPSIENYMYNPASLEITMIDIDSFSFVLFENAEIIFNVEGNIPRYDNL